MKKLFRITLRHHLYDQQGRNLGYCYAIAENFNEAGSIVEANVAPAYKKAKTAYVIERIEVIADEACNTTTHALYLQ